MDAPAILQTLRDVADGKTPDLSLFTSFAKSAGGALHLVDLALSAGGSDDERKAIDAHCQHERWADDVPLRIQELRVLLDDNPQIELDLETIYSCHPQVLKLLKAIVDDEAGRRDAAAKLLEMHRTICAELANRARDMKLIEARLGDCHIMQAQAQLRLEQVEPDLTGKRVLEIGCAEGDLVRRFRKLGAQAIGCDIERLAPDDVDVVIGDFRDTELPGPFDVVVATAVFELGSGFEGEDTDAALDRLYALLDDDGLLVMENVALPFVFDDEQISRHGFTIVPTAVPSATAWRRVSMSLGGRGVVLRKTSGANKA